jgi:SnoaL-like domain
MEAKNTDHAAPPAASLEDLLDIEAIKALKYAYFRLLDSKQFDELGLLLTEDVTTSYESGTYSHNGPGEVVTFLSTSLGDGGIIHEHLGHHPEISIGGDGTAVGYWYLHDRVVVPAVDFELGGTAIYRDEYRKVDGTWKISHTGYDRVYEEQKKLSTGELTSLKSRFDADKS